MPATFTRLVYSSIKNNTMNRCSPFAVQTSMVSTSLVIAEPQTSVAQLFAKNTVLFAQVLDHVKLALIHLAGDSDE
jgi:hypothetical protein